MSEPKEEKKQVGGFLFADDVTWEEALEMMDELYDDYD